MDKVEKEIWHSEWREKYDKEDKILIAKILGIITDFLDGSTEERAGDFIVDLHSLLFDRLWEEHCYLAGTKRQWSLQLKEERKGQNNANNLN